MENKKHGFSVANDFIKEVVLLQIRPDSEDEIEDTIDYELPPGTALMLAQMLIEKSLNVLDLDVSEGDDSHPDQHG